MDARFPREGKLKKRMRRVCHLCNETCHDSNAQIEHYTSAVHKQVKRIKKAQYSYTKNLKTLDEMIKELEDKEPLIGLENIYQYAADRRGAVAYVCTLCDRVFRLENILFHIVGIKHRTLYLSKNFPIMGIDHSFKLKSPSDYRSLVSAADIIVKNHGQKNINVYNTVFSPKKNSSLTYDSESADEGLSSSEDELDNLHSTARISATANVKPFQKHDRATSRSAVDDDNQYMNRRFNLPSLLDFRVCSPLSNVGGGGPAFHYDDRWGPEIQDMDRPLRIRGDPDFHHDGRDIREDSDRLPMELSYQQRHSVGRKVASRIDFPGGLNSSSQMHRDRMSFLYDDRQGPLLHGDRDMPSLVPLHSQINLEDIKRQNMKRSHPSDFPDDHNLHSQLHRDGMTLQRSDKEGQVLQGDPRHTDDQVRNSDPDFVFQHDRSTQSLDKPHDDMPSLKPLGQQVGRDGIKGQNKTPIHHPNFPSNHDLGARTLRDVMAFENDRREPRLQGDPRDFDKLRKADRDFDFQHDQSTRLLGNAKDDFNMPSMGRLRQQVDRTQNPPTRLFDDHDLHNQILRGSTGFQYDGKQGPLLLSDLSHAGNQAKEKNKDFAFQHGQSTRLLGGPHDDLNMPSKGQLCQQEDHHDFKNQSRKLHHPPDIAGDHNLDSPVNRDGMAFQYNDRQGPFSQGSSRHTDKQVKNDGHASTSHDQSIRSHRNAPGDLDILFMRHQQAAHDDLKGQNRAQSPPPDFSGDRDLSTERHRGGLSLQFDDRQGPLLQGASRHTANKVRDNDQDSAFRHDQSTRSQDNTYGDLEMPSMGRPRVDYDIKDQKRTPSQTPDFLGDHDPNSLMHQGRKAFQSVDIQGAVPQGGLGHIENRLGKNNRSSALQLEHQRQQLLSSTLDDLNVPSMKSFYQEGESRSTEKGHLDISSDHHLHSQKHQGGTVHDSHSVDHIGFLMRGDGSISFRGLSSSEDELDNLHSTARISATANVKPFQKHDRATSRSAVDDDNQYMNRRFNLPSLLDFRVCSPLSNVGGGGPAFHYDDRWGPEIQDMDRPLRIRGDPDFHHDGRDIHEDSDRLPMELSYQQRHSVGRKVASRIDFPGGLNSSSQMHRDRMSFLYDDRQGPLLHGDLDMPSLVPLHSQINLEDIKRQNMKRSYPSDFPDDHNLHSQLHRDGMTLQRSDKEGQVLQGDPRHTDDQVRNSDPDFVFQHDRSTQSLDKPHDDMPSLKPLGQQVGRDSIKGQNKTPIHHPNFPSNHDLGARTLRDVMAFENDRREPRLQGDPRDFDKLRKADRDFDFQHDQSTRLLGNAKDDFNMPSMGRLRQQVDRTQNPPTRLFDDHDLHNQMLRGSTGFQYDGKQGPLLLSDLSHAGNQAKEKNKDFAFQHGQSTRLLGGPHDDLNMPSKGQLCQQEDHHDFKNQSRKLHHPPDIAGDHNLDSPVNRDGMAFQYNDRQGPFSQGSSRHTDKQVKNDGHASTSHDQSIRSHRNAPGDLDILFMRPLHQQAAHDDLKGQNRAQSPPSDFSGDRDLSTERHRGGLSLQFDDRQGPLLQGASRHTANKVRDNDQDSAFRHDQSTRSQDNTYGDLEMPSMGRPRVDYDTKDQKRTPSQTPDFLGDHDPNSLMHQGRKAFQSVDIQGAVPQGGLGHIENRLGKNNRSSALQLEHQRQQLLSSTLDDLNVPSMKSFYQEGESRSTEKGHLDISSDHHLHSQKHQGGTVHDSHSVDHIGFLMRGDGSISFQALKAAHESGLLQEHSGMDEQSAKFDSDLEVCSMDLSDCDSIELWNSTEVFDFLKTFKVYSYEDEQFVLKIRALLTKGSAKYQKVQEELLKRRITEEKLRLEEEKQAFLKLRKSIENPKPSKTILKKNNAPPLPPPPPPPPPPSSSLKFPITTSNNTGMANKPISLLALKIDPPALRHKLQLYPEPPSAPSNLQTGEPQYLRVQKSFQIPSERHLEERFSQFQREDLFPSRERSDGPRNLPPRFPSHASSMKY